MLPTKFLHILNRYWLIALLVLVTSLLVPISTVSANMVLSEAILKIKTGLQL